MGKSQQRKFAAVEDVSISSPRSAKSQSSAPHRKVIRKRVGEIPLMQLTAAKLGMRDVLGRHIRRHGNEKVAAIDTIMLLAFNIAKGRQPLYELTQWVHSLDSRMFDFDTLGVTFTDDRFARALDKVFAMDRASAMTELVIAMVNATGLDLSRLHNDSTTLKACGKIPGQTQTGFFLARGHSKDYRPDLKQLVYSLTVSSDGAVPVHFKSYPGNTTDDTTHIETWEVLRKIAGKSEFLYVADSKVCTDKQLSYIVRAGGRVVTIIPNTWKEVGEFKEALRINKKAKKVIWKRRKPNGAEDEMETFSCYLGRHKSIKRGYSIHWIYSSEKKKRDRAARQAKLQKAEHALAKLCGKLNTRNLKTKTQIEQKVASLLKHYEVADFYHVDVTEVQEEYTRQVGRGRPGKETQYQTVYTTIFSLVWARHKKRLQQEQNTDGIFPLLSTDSELSAKDVLVAYKYQPNIEKRFQQLKTIHEGAPLLFKRIDRVEAIMFVFFMALMLQAVIERQVRRQMKKEGRDAVPIYPEHRKASHPTTSKIVDRFYDVSTYELTEKKQVLERFKDELTETQKELLRLLKIQENQYWHFAE